MAQNKPDFTALYETTNSGAEFLRYVERMGYALAQGNKQRLMLVGEHGQTFNLVRCVSGVKTRDMRQKLSDIDLTTLPPLDDVLNTTRI